MCALHLEQYCEAFQSAGLATLGQCRGLTADHLEQMGITLPGHQKRILASLNKTQSPRVRREKDWSSEDEAHSRARLRDRPVPIPGEDKAAHKSRDGETPRPLPRERERPVPKERQVSKSKEQSGDEGEKKPVPGQRHTGLKEAREGGTEGEKKPVPKERTKFRTTPPADSPPPVPSMSEPFLPPVPPRSTLNCPPQRFTSPRSPSPAARTSVSPRPERRAVKAPTAQARSVSPVSTPVHTPTQAPPQPPTFPSAQARPQTLAVLPVAVHQGDGGRKASPTSPAGALPGEDRNAPPLPPKGGGTPKGPPPLPQRFPGQSPNTHR